MEKNSLLEFCVLVLFVELNDLPWLLGYLRQLFVVKRSCAVDRTLKSQY